MKKLVLVVLVAAPLLAAPVKTVSLQQSGSARVGSAAPSFGGWSLDGRKVLTLDGLRRAGGMSPLLVTFGASWCTACAQGLPRLVAFSKKHPEVRLVLVDVESDGAAAQQWATRMGVEGPALLDKFEQIARTYGVSGAQDGGKQTTSLPRTFLVDVGGKVRAIYREEGNDLEAVIERDLGAARLAVTADARQ